MIVRNLLYSLLLFAFVLLAINFVHFRFFTVNVVLYSALQDVALAVVVAGAICWYGIFRRQADRIMFALLTMVFVLSGYIYAISVPTVIDRSLSIYIVEKLQQSGGSIKLDAFEKLFTEQYMPEHRLVDVRLTEQLESGTVVIENGCVKLTGRGEAVADFTGWYRRHMLPSQRLLMGKYTDALTDPLRRNADMTQYRCE